MKKTIIGITGAGGYIANSFIEKIKNNTEYNLKVLYHSPPKKATPSVDFMVGDIRLKKDMDEFTRNVDVIIHAAAKLGNGFWEDFYDNNVLGTQQLISSAIENGVKKFIFISSIEVYGNFRNKKIYESNEIIFTGNYYADSKIMGEKVVSNMIGNTADMSYFIIRPGMVYGPGSLFWTQRLYNQAQNQAFECVGRGDGNVYPIYIDDLIDGIMRIVRESFYKNEIYNMVNPQQLTWYQWGKMFGEIAGVKNPLIYVKPIHIVKRYLFKKFIKKQGKSNYYSVYTRKGEISMEKVNEELLWTPNISIITGMQRCKEWLLKQKRI